MARTATRTHAGPVKATQPLGNVARAVVRDVVDGSRRRSLVLISSRGLFGGVVFDGPKTSFLQAFPSPIVSLSRVCDKEGSHREKVLRDLNLHHHFPKQVVDVYLRYRPLVPLISKPGSV